jgi:type IX secretion system PorP/SprF family membrane protein
MRYNNTSVLLRTYRNTGIFLAAFLLVGIGFSQDENPYVTYDVPFQNLLKFNRFLVNPTFSTVREDKSYINFFHRSQAAAFDDNKQDYFLSYSGRINDRIGLGLSIYNQQEGVISNIGAMANYAYGVRLSQKSVLTFGVNIPYYQSTFDERNVITVEEDPALSDLDDSSIIAIQPGLNLAIGAFDVGVFAENLMDFNLKSGGMLTEFGEKTFSGHLQYTQKFKSNSGILEDARLMPLARIRKVGSETYTYGGGVILDLPKLGWLQGGYDSYYGASVGTGFSLNRRLSIGYNLEKGLGNSLDNFGATHELSLAYSFTPNLTENVVEHIAEDTGAYVMNEPESEENDRLLKRLRELENKYEETQMLLDEMIYRQDSLELAHIDDSERRFELVMRSMKREMSNESEYAFRSDSRSATMSVAEYNASSGRQVVKKVETTSVSAEPIDNHAGNGFNDPRDLVIRHMAVAKGIPQGRYIVANVFKTEKYLTKFMKDLKEMGLDANYFKNPENGLNYVYLAHYEDNATAMEAYQSRMDGRYQDNIWIMHVDNPRYSNMANLKFEE